MSWYHLPCTASSLQAETDTYRFFAQFMLAMRDRTWASSGNTYPQVNAVWATTATSVTLAQNTDKTWSLYDSTANWITGSSTSACAGMKKFFDFTCTALPYLPRYYDAICDSDNEREVVRCRIVAQADLNHVTLENTIDDYVTAGCIPSTAWLAGRPWKFIPRDGLTWTDRDDSLGRWLTWIGDQQVYAGDAGQSASVLTITPATGVMWTPSAYVGKTLAIGASGTSGETRTIYEGDATRLVTDRFTTSPTGAIRILDGTTVLATGTIMLVKDGLYVPALTSNNAVITFAPTKVTAKELLVRVGDGGPGTLRRLDVLDSVAHTLIFDRQTLAASGSFVVVNAGGCAFPARRKPMPFAFYSGALDRVWGHRPDDTLLGTPRPASTVSFISGTLPDCPDDPTPFPAKDLDVWSAIDEECSPADKCYSPRLLKTWRGWQNFILGQGYLFVEAFSYTNVSSIPYTKTAKSYAGASAIPTLTPARHFAVAGLNHGSATIGGTSGAYTIGVSGFEGATIYWTVLSATGDNFASGSGLCTSATVNVGGDDSLAGKSVIWSAGYTRKKPKHIARLYPATIFVNDSKTTTDADGDTILTVFPTPTVDDFCGLHDDPPATSCTENCLGVGYYTKYAPSTSFTNYDGDGLAKDSSDLFQPGDAARYIGDEYSNGIDPVDVLDFSPGRLDGKSPETPCYDRAYEGQHSKPPFGAMQARLTGDRSGTATGGTRYSLTDAGKSWLGDWFAGSVTKTHAGTLVAGGTSSVTLDAWTHDPTDERSCYFDAGRFVGFTAAFADFVIEIDRTVTTDGVTTTTTYKMPLTSVTTGVATLKYTVSSPGVTFQAGDAWRIKEAWKINRYESKRVTLIDPATNAKHVVTITHSDADTLYFAQQTFTVGAGWKYQIMEYDTGGVWLYATSAPTDPDTVYQQIGPNAFWVQPTGDDPRGEPWKKDGTLNEPHWFTRYGLIEKNDYVGPTLINELYRMIDVLRWTKLMPRWTSRSNPATSELNVGPHVSYSDDSADDDGSHAEWVSLLSAYQTFMSSTTSSEFNSAPSEHDGGAPGYQVDGLLYPTGSTIEGGSSYAYGVASPPNALARTVDFFALASPPPSAEVDNVTVTEFDAGGRHIVQTLHQANKFDAQGTGLIGGEYVKYASVGATTQLRVVSPKLGTAGYVAPVHEPTPFTSTIDSAGVEHDEYGRLHFGYAIADHVAIAEFDVPGGMTYVS